MELGKRQLTCALSVYRTITQLARSADLRLNVSDEGQGDTRSFGDHGVWGLLSRPPKSACELCASLCAFRPIAYSSQARGLYQSGSASRYIGSAPQLFQHSERAR